MRFALCPFLLLICFTAVALGTEVTGHVRQIRDKEGDRSTVVVYAEPLDEHVVPKPGHYQLAQKNKTFIPHILAIPEGSTVTLPNDDPIFHNVFSLSRPAPFDMGLYRSGASKSITFQQPAIYHVFCNIHPQMSAVILVLPTAWITEANTKGAYSLNVPPGRYRVTAWSERSHPVSAEITVASTPVNVDDLNLDESKFVEIKHENKYGQDYAPSAYAGERH